MLFFGQLILFRERERERERERGMGKRIFFLF